MATYGWSSPNWGSSWKFFGFNTDNNVAAGGTMPEPGTITAVSFNCDALSGSGSGMTAIGCVWSTAGALLGSGGSVALSYAGQHAGPYGWHTSGGMSLHLAGGTTFKMGWWRDPSAGVGSNIWGFAAGGTEFRGTTAGSTGAGSFGQDATDNDQIGVYITYTPDAIPGPPGPGTRRIINQSWLPALMDQHLIPGPKGAR